MLFFRSRGGKIFFAHANRCFVQTGHVKTELIRKLRRCNFLEI